MTGKFEKRKQHGVSQKAFIVLLAVVLTVGCAIGGTVAWLVANSDPVVNTFTYGDINIGLTETKEGPFKIVPGCNIEKDPVVTVDANSEDCFLFVKIDKTDWPDTLTETVDSKSVCKVRYTLADGWTELEDGVYYRTVSNSNAAQTFPVLANNQVIVSENLTKDEVNAAAANPSLTFTAYAVQAHKNATETFTAAEAWAKVDVQ